MPSGILALVGGAEFTDGCDFDRRLLEAAGTDQVLVVPTAAAFEHPQRSIDRAVAWFAGLGATAVGLEVYTRRDAMVPEHADAVRASAFTYLVGANPMHARSVFKDSPIWDAIVDTWQQGATLAGSSAGGPVLTDPMVDPRGGAFTVGLGVVAPLAFVPHADTWSDEKLHRTQSLAPSAIPVVGVPERTALLRAADGTWSTSGVGDVRVWLDGHPATLEALPVVADLTD
jgi:cyanophycinase